LSEELTGDPPTDNTMIEEESLWIHSQLTGDGFMFFFGDELNKDIANVLTMLHVKKFEVCKFYANLLHNLLCLLV
jgi:transcription elongation factor SPT6